MPKKGDPKKSEAAEEEAIRKIWNDLKKRNEQEAFAELTKQLLNRVDAVLLKQSQKSQHQTNIQQPCLPRFVKDEKKKKLPEVALVNAEEPVPPHSARLHVEKSYPVDDSPELDFVPSAVADAEENGVNVEEYFGLFDIASREKDIANGPLFQVNKTNDNVIETIQLYHRQHALQTADSKSIVIKAIMELANLDEARAEKLYAEATKETLGTVKQQAPTKTKNGQSPPASRKHDLATIESSSGMNHPSSPRKKDDVTVTVSAHQTTRKRLDSLNGDVNAKDVTTAKDGGDPDIPSSLICQPVAPLTIAQYDPDYLKVVDSYRKIYCNRCKMFDCNIHGLAEKPSLQLSYELGISLEKERKFRFRESMEDEDIRLFPEQEEKEKDPFAHLGELTDFQTKIAKRMFLILEGNIEQMAIVMMAPVEPLRRFVEQKGWKQPESTIVPSIKEDQNYNYHSLKNYDHKWYSRIVKGGLRPSYEPCVHEEPCKDGMCGCVERQVFCTSACAWGPRSRNFFRGCDCRSSCDAKSCSCYANARECNPDICRCDTCSDPSGVPSVEQRCRNDNLTMQRGTEILIGRSGIPNAGWGAFSKRALKKNEFIGEYVGEIITQEEADRRGQLYDIQNHSSLFMLTADVALDADRQGNHLRYINHSSNPNTTPRTITVNGDNRIGFFALQDIPPQTELSFNYGYNFSVDNDFVLKSAKAVPWMEDSVPSDKEDNSTTSSRGKKKAQKPRNTTNMRFAATKVANGGSDKKKGRKSKLVRKIPRRLSTLDEEPDTFEDGIGL